MKKFSFLFLKNLSAVAGTLLAAAAFCAAHEPEPAEHDHDHEAEHVHDHENEAAHDHEALHAGETGVPVKISERARRSIAMRFEKVAPRPIEAERAYYGTMVVPADAVKTCALPVAGRVVFHVRPGQSVSRGEPLFSLASPALVALKSDVAEAEANLLRARSNLAALDARLARLREIGTKNGALENEAAFAKAEIPVLAAALERAREQWKIATAGADFLDGILTVPARTAGTVQTLDLNEGAWGEQGASALTFVADAAPEFKGTVFGNDSFEGKIARLAVDVGGETLRFSGALRVPAQTDEAAQARTVYFAPELPEGASVFPGQIARLEVFSARAADEIFVSVPTGAVVKVGVDDVVFVRDPHDENTFFARKVETLPARRGMTPVKGVRVGETVVSKGAYELKYVLPADGNAPAKKTAGHFHADGKFHEGEH